MEPTLRTQLHQVYDELSLLISVTQRRAFPPGVTALTALDVNGRPILADLLVAKANVLAALAYLGE